MKIGSFKIKTSPKIFTLYIMETEKESRKGLSYQSSLDKDSGYLFIFENLAPNITMSNTKIPLDLIFLDSNFIITDILEGEPNTQDLYQGEGKYVLEVNKGFSKNYNIKRGDKISINMIKNKKLIKKNKKGSVQQASINTQPSNFDRRSQDLKFYPTGYSHKHDKWPMLKRQDGGSLPKSAMYLLDEEGTPQMKMKGGELIFSIIHTKEIMKKVNEINKTSQANRKKLILELGNLVSKFRDKQLSTPAEYVTE